jgi:hypothetical protein
MRYTVTIAADVRYKTYVEADSVEEAHDIAWEDFDARDFGPLDFVSSHIDNIKDKDGNFIE